MRIFISIIVLSVNVSFSQSFSLEKNDSVFAKFSIDQIVNYKKTLQSSIDRNTSKREALNKQGLAVNKSILESKASIGSNQDIMLLRMAEFYIEEALDEFFTANDSYEAKYEKYADQLLAYEEDSSSVSKPILPVEVKVDYTRPISMYDKILNEYPRSQLKDEALYGKAHLLSETDEGKKSREIYRKLIDEYPESPFTPYGIMALADYYFEPGEVRDEDQVIVDLQTSIDLFKDVLRYKSFDRYDEALYRLGWAYYRMAARDAGFYKDAVYYFLLALDDIYAGSELSIGSDYTNVNIKDESIRYIGISFSQEDNPKGGVENLRKFVERLMALDKEYASPIMKSLGDIYHEVREDENTIAAYSAFQELFPFDKESPIIQNRIVTAYRVFDDKIDYRSESRSFEERYNLFKKYNSRSDWYKQLLALDLAEKFEILNDAEKNAERALLTNIQLLYRDILDKEQEGRVAETDYLRLTQMCEEYLDFFPNFDDAFQVHRSYAEILDTKLGRFNKSYEEYIEASNIYPNASFKELKEVAYNAVVVADTLRGIAGDKNISIDFNSDSVKAEQLTASEKRMIEAYENYVKIAPNDTNSAKFIYNISAIYFNRKQFANATRYSKTLLLRYPGAEGEALAQQQVLNGYYARGQYLSAEAVAKRIIEDPSSDKAHVEEAQQRLFDSILKNAQSYQLRNKHYIAGIEFRRAAIDAPFEKRENRRFIALYNSGKEFEKVDDLEQANESYRHILSENDAANKFTRNALINTAFNYKTMEQNKVAGEFFEQVYLVYPDSTNAKQYLANAGASYQQSESWLDAIRINNRYANTFPADERSKDYLFNNAEFYLKLDDFDNANQIYNEFAAKYPDDPRTIEAHYKRGKYYLDRDDKQLARPEFFNAVARNERFKSENKKTDNYHASEAAYYLIQIQEEEYDAIVFNWPKSNIDAQRKVKSDKLSTIKGNYEKLISYGSPRSFEAPYKIAVLYEKYADTFSDQQLNPSERDPAKLFKLEADIRATAAKLYDNSIDKYKQSITDIEKIATKLNINLTGAAVEAEAAVDSLAPISDAQKNMNADSLRNVANRYISRSKEKITSIVFLIAKQSEENIANALNFKSPYEGKVGQESNNLILKDEILTKAVQLQVDKSIEAHRRNLKTAQELQITNKYTEESKRRIIINSNIVADEYDKLKTDALHLFEDYYKEYVALIPKPFGQKSSKYRMDYLGLGDNLSVFLDYATDFNSKSLDGYAATIDVARSDSIKNDLYEYTQKSILKGSWHYVGVVESVRDSLKKKKTLFTNEFNRRSEEDELKYNFEDGKNNLGDVEFVLDESILTALDVSFATSQDLGIPSSPTFLRILKKLIKLEPNTYAGEVPKDTIIVSTDSTWMVSKVFDESMNTYEFNDSTWKKPLLLESTSEIKGLDTLSASVDPIWYADQISTRTVIDSSLVLNAPKLFVDTLTLDSIYYSELDSNQVPIALEFDSATSLPLGFVPEYGTKTVQFTTDTVDSIQIYFRKKFEVTGRLYSGRFLGTGDGIVDFFMNDELITNFEQVEYDSLDTGDWTFFQEALNVGDNVISLWVTDETRPRQGLRFYLELLVLPKEFSQEGDTIIDESTLLVSKDEKNVQSLIKNRIITTPVKSYLDEKEAKTKPIQEPAPTKAEEEVDQSVEGDGDQVEKDDGSNNATGGDTTDEN